MHKIFKRLFIFGLLSSILSVVVSICVVVPCTVKFPFTTNPSSVNVPSVLPFTVIVTEPSATVMLSLPTVIAVMPDIWSSTYFLLANLASAFGAVVLSSVIEDIPVTAFVDAVMATSPTYKPLLTLKLRVVMVHYPSCLFIDVELMSYDCIYLDFSN